MKDRLIAVTQFISSNDKVVDIGCDHAYLSIFLKQNKLCKSVIATDIHENALEIAKKNIKTSKVSINTYLSDGLLNVPANLYDTLILAGMGTSTILHIIDTGEKSAIKKIVVQSNNDLFLLRKEMKSRGFYLQDEKVVYEKNHYYVIGLYTKEKKKIKFTEYLLGIYKKENKNYYLFLEEKLIKINKLVPLNQIRKKIFLNYQIRILKRWLKL